jgi:hypothetical protein
MSHTKEHGLTLKSRSPGSKSHHFVAYRTWSEVGVASGCLIQTKFPSSQGKKEHLKNHSLPLPETKKMHALFRAYPSWNSFHGLQVTSRPLICRKVTETFPKQLCIMLTPLEATGMGRPRSGTSPGHGANRLHAGEPSWLLTRSGLELREGGVSL